jgi:hypothetical protein
MGLRNEQELTLAREYLKEYNCSLVIIKDGEVLGDRQGEGIQPFLEVIEELGSELEGSTIGDRILGKASAFLCEYAKVTNVFAHHASKTGLAVLIRAGIPGEADNIIPVIKDQSGVGTCPYEELVQNIDSAEDAYTLLTQRIW